MSLAVRRRLPGAGPECELARGLGKPVAENLLGRKSAFLEPRPNCLGGFAVLPEIRRGELGSCIELLRNHAVDLTSKTGTIVQHVLDLRSAIADRRAPFDPRVERRRDFEPEQMAQDTPYL